MRTKFTSRPLELIIRRQDDDLIFEQILDGQVGHLHNTNFINFQEQINQGFSNILTEFYNIDSLDYQNLEIFFYKSYNISYSIFKNFSGLNRLTTDNIFKEIKLHIRGNIFIPFDLFFYIQPKNKGNNTLSIIQDLLKENKIANYLFGYKFNVSYQINSNNFQNNGQIWQPVGQSLPISTLNLAYTGCIYLSNYMDEFNSIQQHFPNIDIHALTPHGAFPSEVYQKHLLHISAHNENQLLVITDDMGGNHLLTAHRLIPIDNIIPITFLNICSGNNNFNLIQNSIAFTLLYNNLSYSVIANCFEVPNSVAEEFSSKFYEYLSMRPSEFELEDILYMLRKEENAEINPYLYAYSIWNNETKITLIGDEIGK